MKRSIIWLRHTRYKGMPPTLFDVTPEAGWGHKTAEERLENLIADGDLIPCSPLIELDVEFTREEDQVAEILRGLDRVESVKRAQFEREYIEPLQKRRAQLRQIIHQTEVEVIEKGRGGDLDAGEGDFEDLPPSNP